MSMEAIRPGRYRHFKGNEYEVLFLAQHSETEEPMVVYRALYGERGLWVRPASMWNETVERGGEKVPRFTYIGGEAPSAPRAEMTQEARIACYEAILDRAADAAAQLDGPLEAFAALQPLVRVLDAYYGGAQWRQDLADDEAGRLPAGLRRGVLSEDGAYDALCENRRLLGRMAEIAAEAERFAKEENAE